MPIRIFGDMLLDFIELFQDGAILNLEYHLFHVNWCVLTLVRLKHALIDIYSENRDISLDT